MDAALVEAPVALELVIVGVLLEVALAELGKGWEVLVEVLVERVEVGEAVGRALAVDVVVLGDVLTSVPTPPVDAGEAEDTGVLATARVVVELDPIAVVVGSAGLP